MATGRESTFNFHNLKHTVFFLDYVQSNASVDMVNIPFFNMVLYIPGGDSRISEPSTGCLRNQKASRMQNVKKKNGFPQVACGLFWKNCLFEDPPISTLLVFKSQTMLQDFWKSKKKQVHSANCYLHFSYIDGRQFPNMSKQFNPTKQKKIKLIFCWNRSCWT